MASFRPQVQKRNADSIKITKRQQELAEFQILKEERDIVFLSGTYVGKKVSEVWQSGAAGRDWIIKSVWSQNNEEVNEIIKQFFC
jgi:hypothetical protein